MKKKVFFLIIVNQILVLGCQQKMKMQINYNYFNSFSGIYINYSSNIYEDRIDIFTMENGVNKKITVKNLSISKEVYDYFCTENIIEPEVEFDDYENALELVIGNSDFKIVSFNDDFSKISPSTYRGFNSLYLLHKYILKEISVG